MKALATLFLLASSTLFPQGLNPAKLGGPPIDTWPTYNGDYSGRRYSTLSKINQSNINSLGLAWVYRANGALGGNTGFGGRISGNLFLSRVHKPWTRAPDRH